jgi:hypothetical protein
MIKHTSAPRPTPLLVSARPALAAVLAALASLLLVGCLDDTPITATASTNIDTRLLGVFEYQERVKRAETDPALADGEKPPMIIHRAAILPRDADTYWIYYRNFSQSPAKVLRFIGWISRVDGDHYLSFQDDTAGSRTLGKFSFVKFAWTFPGNFTISAPNMQGVEAGATPFDRRAIVRARLEEGTLFPYEATPWDKIARVYWDRKAENPTIEIPKEFEEGTTRQFPGL